MNRNDRIGWTGMLFVGVPCILAVLTSVSESSRVPVARAEAAQVRVQPTERRPIGLPAVPDAPWVGQKPPGSDPVLFAPGFVSTGLYERDAAFSPDGREFYYTLFTEGVATIMVTKRGTGGWSEPRAVSFARPLEFFDAEPSLSPDGRSIYFLSTRPPAGEKPKPGWGYENIWTADRGADGEWGEARMLPAPVNVKGQSAFYASLTDAGTLYFTRRLVAGNESSEMSICRATRADGGFNEPEKLPAAVNVPGRQIYNACIAPDESFLVACVAPGKGSEAGGGPRYLVFFRDAKGGWSEGVDPGPSINPPGVGAIAPSVTRDGRYFMFAQARTDALKTLRPIQPTLMDFERLAGMPGNGSSDIYWVDAQVLRALRPGGGATKKE